MSENIEISRSYTVSKASVMANKENLEELGFIIKTFDRFPKLAKVTVPDNFIVTVVIDDNYRSMVDFYDETNNKRGSFCINKKNNVGSAIILNKRINVLSQRHGANNEFQQLYIGTPTQKLIAFDSINTSIGSQLYIMNQAADLTAKLKSAADEVFPNWENPMMYWELTDEELLGMVANQKEEMKKSRINQNL